jgi:7-cyano-7-deazaguanosine (preQ0) biosynthesis protein QueE
MIIINEIYGPILQGEGKSAGKKMMFVRLSGCNLACVWCDTPYTWNWIGTKFAHPDKFNPKKESHPMESDEILEKLQQLSIDTKAIILSGGEPTLQQKNLIPLLKLLKENNYWIEVETNGTNVLSDEFISLVDQINCSPKLSNSGIDNPLSKREIPVALEKLALQDKTIFKFVVITEDDLNEILMMIKKYNMKNIYLMPEGRTKEEQLDRQNRVEKICQQRGFNFSPRLHILEFGNKRGV